MTKGSTEEVDLCSLTYICLNRYIKIGASNYIKPILKAIKGENDNRTITVRDL